MLPVSAWPPGPPGASLSPFGKPRQVTIGCNGFVIPTGAWIVATGSNRVVMFRPPVSTANPARSPGTGLLPGSIPPARTPPFDWPCPPRPPRQPPAFDWPCPPVPPSPPVVTPFLPPPASCPPSNVFRPNFRRYNDVVEAFRAWQRATGNTDPPLRPLAGRRPPNWYGWQFVNAPCSVLVGGNRSGLVIADGQNVVIAGSGTATLTQAYSV